MFLQATIERENLRGTFLTSGMRHLLAPLLRTYAARGRTAKHSTCAPSFLCGDSKGCLLDFRHSSSSFARLLRTYDSTRSTLFLLEILSLTYAKSFVPDSVGGSFERLNGKDLPRVRRNLRVENLRGACFKSGIRHLLAHLMRTYIRVARGQMAKTFSRVRHNLCVGYVWQVENKGSPSLVWQDAATGRKAVSYSRLLVTLVAAFQVWKPTFRLDKVDLLLFVVC